MADLSGMNEAARRAADVLLRGVGGCTVKLRMSAPAVPNDVTEQVGLGLPVFQDVELAPVVLRSARMNSVDGSGAVRELLASAKGVQNALAGLNASDAVAVLSGLAGVLVDEKLMTVENVETLSIDGAPYAYRLLLRSPQVRPA